MPHKITNERTESYESCSLFEQATDDEQEPFLKEQG
jgi:hypothetical protein